MQEYRKRAEEAERLSGSARNPEEKAAFEEVARLWRRMAKEETPKDPEDSHP
jgi:ferric-dicitrate binding protein FerR (iron transport regulator)